MTLIGSGFKAAVIGCGGMGRGHMAKAKSLGIELVGYCDEIEGKAAEALAEFGGSYATTDADRIMRDDSIDLIDSNRYPPRCTLSARTCCGASRQTYPLGKTDVRDPRPSCRSG